MKRIQGRATTVEKIKGEGRSNVEEKKESQQQTTPTQAQLPSIILPSFKDILQSCIELLPGHKKERKKDTNSVSRASYSDSIIKMTKRNSLSFSISHELYIVNTRNMYFKWKHS